MVTITPEVKEHLWTALTSLASAPDRRAHITGLAVLLQSRPEAGARPVLHRRSLWDGCSMPNEERLGEASVQAFETEGLVATGAAAAVLAYLFHRIGAARRLADHDHHR
jgi:type IV secretory pathway VirB4 component